MKSSQALLQLAKPCVRWAVFYSKSTTRRSRGHSLGNQRPDPILLSIQFSQNISRCLSRSRAYAIHAIPFGQTRGTWASGTSRATAFFRKKSRQMKNRVPAFSVGLSNGIVFGVVLLRNAIRHSLEFRDNY